MTPEERAEMVKRCRYILSQHVMLRLMDEKLLPDQRAYLAVNQADWLLFALNLSPKPT